MVERAGVGEAIGRGQLAAILVVAENGSHGGHERALLPEGDRAGAQGCVADLQEPGEIREAGSGGAGVERDGRLRDGRSVDGYGGDTFGGGQAQEGLRGAGGVGDGGRRLAGGTARPT